MLSGIYQHDIAPTSADVGQESIDVPFFSNPILHILKIRKRRGSSLSYRQDLDDTKSRRTST